MNEQLAALWGQHRTALMVGGAAGVAGLAYLKRKKGGGGTTIGPGGTVLGAVSPQTVPASGGAYDSSATDVYNSLQSELEQLTKPAQGAPLSVPAPIASTIFQPTYNGNYGRLPNGEGVEIESDGSLFHINDQAANQIASQGGKFSSLVQNLGWYSLTGNAAAAQSGQAPQAMTYDAGHNLVPWKPNPTSTTTALP